MDTTVGRLKAKQSNRLAVMSLSSAGPAVITNSEFPIRPHGRETRYFWMSHLVKVILTPTEIVIVLYLIFIHRPFFISITYRSKFLGTDGNRGKRLDPAVP